MGLARRSVASVLAASLQLPSRCCGSHLGEESPHLSLRLLACVQACIYFAYSEFVFDYFEFYVHFLIMAAASIPKAAGAAAAPSASMVPPSGPTPPLRAAEESAEEYAYGAEAGETPSFLPPPDEVDDINADGGKLSAIFAFCGIDADDGITILSTLGLQPDDHYSTLGSIRSEELEEAMNDMRIDGKPPKIGLKAKIRNTLRVGRTLAGMKELPPSLSI